VADVELNEQEDEVVVQVEHDCGPLSCPQCGHPARRYDTRRRRRRHLDTCEYRTIVHLLCPHVICADRRVSVPQIGDDQGSYIGRIQKWHASVVIGTAVTGAQCSRTGVDGGRFLLCLGPRGVRDALQGR